VRKGLEKRCRIFVLLIQYCCVSLSFILVGNYVTTNPYHGETTTGQLGILEFLGIPNLLAAAQENASPNRYLINTVIHNLRSIGGIAISDGGTVFVADSFLNRIYRIERNSLIPVAGNGDLSFGALPGQLRFSGDGGQAIQAQLDNPQGLAIDSSGSLFVSDSMNQRIRKISSDGIISTIAGTGNIGFGGDGGPALLARFSHPAAVSIDKLGNLYVADRENNRIRKIILASGVITTIAGNGVKGFSGDGGPAIKASLNFPHGVFVDDAGIVYIADTFNSRIRMVDSNGVIHTLAGNGKQGFDGDGGPPQIASLGVPDSLVVDKGGNVFVADRPNGIRRISPTGTIQRIAGNGSFSELTPTADELGDGRIATAVPLFTTVIAQSSNGELYIDDRTRLRILAPLNDQ
jgi:trimeric autotransporter adhesin